MRTVLVTGGTVRIGRAISERLRADGWRVLASSHRGDAGADIVADLSREDGADRLFDETLRRLDGAFPDALVNNAAVFSAKRVLETVNFRAPVRLMERMAARPSGVGSVVNILDCKMHGREGHAPARPLAYLDTKRALWTETLRFARAHADTLRVNAVAPGPVLAPIGVHEKAGAILLSHRPTPDDIASAVAFLLSAESVTGVCLDVDAGQHLLEGTP